MCRSQWPRGLKHRSSAARLLRLWDRIAPGAWMFVCCECCVLSGRGLCEGLITRPEESYLLWRVVACDQETSNTRRLKSATGLWKIQPQWVVTPGKQTNKLGKCENVVQGSKVATTVFLSAQLVNTENNLTVGSSYEYTEYKPTVAEGLRFVIF